MTIETESSTQTAGNQAVRQVSGPSRRPSGTSLGVAGRTEIKFGQGSGAGLLRAGAWGPGPQGLGARAPAAWGPGPQHSCPRAAGYPPYPPPPPPTPAAFLVREKGRGFSPSPLLKPSNTPPKVGGYIYVQIRYVTKMGTAAKHCLLRAIWQVAC